MEKILDQISERMQAAFAAAGYDTSYGRVSVSNRPDLCEYQCNGALAAAKAYHKAPLEIAQDIVRRLNAQDFSMVEAVRPGFINLRLSPCFLRDYLEQMRLSPRFGVQEDPHAGTVVVDYGGPNVAKPLHIGHLRSAIIGESVKRINRFFGNHTIGDVHLGDWGLQMGLIITGLREREPELPYFEEDYTGEYPTQAPFTLSELEKIYPEASARSKEDEDFASRAHQATLDLQQGRRGYLALWRHIMALSVADIKRNYDRLDVHFESWLGESDAQPYIAPMLADLKARGFAQESEGALVFPVAEETDKKEVPPCILVKSDGATLYATTDLATLVQRQRDVQPGKLIYLADKRQSLHFDQVFRAAKKSGIVPEETQLEFIGFGTMNGKDGKPFKTRAGGVMRLQQLIDEITDYVRQKVVEGQIVPADKVEETTAKIAMAALKYGDLYNQPTKDYVFDLDRFAAFEGNTGPYILYTIVRVKSILSRYGAWEALPIQEPTGEYEKELALTITRLAPTLESAYRSSAPNQICAFVYELAGAVNKFYHETRILGETDETKKAGYIALIALAKNVLETCIDLLGFSAPDQM